MFKSISGNFFINCINGGLVGGRTCQDGHSVLVSDILDIPILNNLIADFSTDRRCPRFEESYCLVQKASDITNITSFWCFNRECFN